MQSVFSENNDNRQEGAGKKHIFFEYEKIETLGGQLRVAFLNEKSQ